MFRTCHQRIDDGRSKRVAMRCSVLQCVAVCCSALQFVAVCRSRFTHVHGCILFSKSQHTWIHSFFKIPTMRCSLLQCVAVRCSLLQCVAVRCSLLQCVAVRCSVLGFFQKESIHVCGESHVCFTRVHWSNLHLIQQCLNNSSKFERTPLAYVLPICTVCVHTTIYFSKTVKRQCIAEV